MAVNFNKFAFKNLNSIPVKLVLEAPAGTQVRSVEVAANGTYETNPNVNDTPSAKITVTAQDHHSSSETVSLTGAPYHAYIEMLEAESSIGSVHGKLLARF